MPGVNGVDRSNDKMRLYTADPVALLAEVMAYAQAQALRVTALNTAGPSLEDVFLSVTGLELGPEQHKFQRGQCRNCPARDQCDAEDEQEREKPPRRTGLLKSACGR